MILDKELEEFIEVIKDAVNKNGMISRKLAHFVFTGPTGSGKSSLIASLLRRPKKTFSKSTGVSESVIIVDINEFNPTTFLPVSVIDFSTWEEMEYEMSLLKQMDPESIVLADTQPSQVLSSCQPQPFTATSASTSAASSSCAASVSAAVAATIEGIFWVFSFTVQV